ncbi:MAG TPA: PilN domain-containing protein [Thermoanaerobaculia bacterium]|jgi:type IV pilus assembly protein PilN|nr:PilN domain-containing protein [Thermoanaerobaculia bacterium]
MIRINLISEGKKAPAVRSARLRAFNINAQNIAVFCVIASFVLALLAYGGYWLYMNTQLKRQQAQIEELKATVAELEEIIKEVERFEKRKVELQHKINVITDLRNNQRGPVHIMDQVSRALPDFLWLDRMEMSAATVTIQGKAFTTSSVANFIENLDGVAEFQEPVLKIATWRGQVYDFQIAFNYTPVPVARTPDGAPAPAPGTTPAAGTPPVAGQEAAAR